MDRIVILHRSLQVTILLALTALVVAALVDAWRGRLGRWPLALAGIAQLLIVAEALLGLPLLLAGPPPALHIVYGAVALAWLPVAGRLARGRPGRYEALTFAALALLLAGLVLRAAQTGGP